MRNAVITLAFVLPSFAFAQDASDDHRVTVEVREVNTLQVLGGDLVLVLDELDANDPQRFAPASDDSASLVWSTNAQARKITVESDLASPRYELEVQATAIQGSGSAAGAVVLDAANGARDLVTGISEEAAGCTLSYVARADVADGIGSETHTVTYTLTAM